MNRYTKAFKYLLFTLYPSKYQQLFSFLFLNLFIYISLSQSGLFFLVEYYYFAFTALLLSYYFLLFLYLI